MQFIIGLRKLTPDLSTLGYGEEDVGYENSNFISEAIATQWGTINDK